MKGAGSAEVDEVPDPRLAQIRAARPLQVGVGVVSQEAICSLASSNPLVVSSETVGLSSATVASWCDASEVFAGGMQGCRTMRLGRAAAGR